ncbi:MAG: restriction endonuclease subunit S [Caldilineaceae bacterium]
MSGRFAPYPDYQMSEVSWLGRIPTHWKVTRAKNLFYESNELSISGEEEQLSVSHMTGVTSRSEKNVTMFKAESYVGHKICQPNDLVINTMWAWMGALGVSRIPGIVSPSYGVYRPKDVNLIHAQYYDSLLRTPHYVAEYVRRSTGIHSSRLRLYPDEFLRMPLLFPPLEEQTQIAKFLDYETANIDALIAKQQQLIALLQEKRQAVISHAVTKGLNPAAPLRDSGVAWLGQVPAHWEVKQLRRVLTSIEQGTSPSASANPPDVGETGVLKISAIKNGVFREFEAKSLDGAPFEEAYRVRKGDLLVTRGNTPDLVADSCVVREEPKAHLMMSDLIYRLNVSDNADANFLCLWLLSSLGRLQIKNDARGSSMTMAKIAQGHIKAWLTTLPPVDEQKRIVDHVDQMNGRTSLLLSQCGSLIQLLQERRTALISAAVTGKIDVRGWQPPPAAAAGGFDEPHGAKATVLSNDAG